MVSKGPAVAQTCTTVEVYVPCLRAEHGFIIGLWRSAQAPRTAFDCVPLVCTLLVWATGAFGCGVWGSTLDNAAGGLGRQTQGLEDGYPRTVQAFGRGAVPDAVVRSFRRAGARRHEIAWIDAWEAGCAGC